MQVGPEKKLVSHQKCNKYKIGIAFESFTQTVCNPIPKYNVYLPVCNSCLSTVDQLISKCPFGVIVWTKIPTEKLTNYCPNT